LLSRDGRIKLDSLSQSVECLIVRRSEDYPFVGADQDYQHEFDPAVVSFIHAGWCGEADRVLGAYCINSRKRDILA